MENRRSRNRKMLKSVMWCQGAAKVSPSSSPTLHHQSASRAANKNHFSDHITWIKPASGHRAEQHLSGGRD